ncbi:MAG: aminodeoxychorismate synthase component [Pseudomonadota bacterium]
MSPCFALLDDHGQASRLYTGYQRTLCGSSADLPAALREMQTAIAAGSHALGLFDYELGAALQTLPHQPGARAGFEIVLFTQCQHLNPAQLQQWLAAQTSAGANLTNNQPAGLAQVRSNISAAEFAQALAAIHAYIEAGDTYQVNFTYRLHFQAYGDLCQLYARLRARQAVPYGALICLPDGRAVLSFSPELFVRHQAGQLTTRPMKGTAAASGDDTTDAARAAALAQDSKNRAENLMIVDLLRNDLGRIAQTGSVSVPALFQVQRYNSVLQMTSTVSAQLRPDASLAEVFAALYPCGSITGAPKRRTMEIIHQLETEPRGLYTGAIGWFDAAQAGHQVNDFCLSVPIRTLSLQAPDPSGLRAGVMGVGAGIVYDSDTAEELRECQLKASFLTGLQPTFELFETMYATRAQGCRHQQAHLQRLAQSAQYFGFNFDLTRLETLLAQTCSKLAGDCAHRVKLILSADGSARCETGILAEISQPVRIRLAQRNMPNHNLFLRHKTTVRQEYDAGWQQAEREGAFDTLFYDADGNLCEGGRSNVFLNITGCWLTPPLSMGVLPGIMRQHLLQELAAQERVVTLADLRSAQKVLLCNALRGALDVALV